MNIPKGVMHFQARQGVHYFFDKRGDTFFQIAIVGHGPLVCSSI